MLLDVIFTWFRYHFTVKHVLSFQDIYFILIVLSFVCSINKAHMCFLICSFIWNFNKRIFYNKKERSWERCLRRGCLYNNCIWNTIYGKWIHPRRANPQSIQSCCKPCTCLMSLWTQLPLPPNFCCYFLLILNNFLKKNKKKNIDQKGINYWGKKKNKQKKGN